MPHCAIRHLHGLALLVEHQVRVFERYLVPAPTLVRLRPRFLSKHIDCLKFLLDIWLVIECLVRFVTFWIEEVRDTFLLSDLFGSLDMVFGLVDQLFSVDSCNVSIFDHDLVVVLQCVVVARLNVVLKAGCIGRKFQRLWMELLMIVEILALHLSL